jgi:hypothetical protein
MSTPESTPHIYHGQAYARVDPLTLCQSRLYPPQSGTLDLTSEDRAANAERFSLGGAALGLPLLADQVDPRQQSCE